VVEAAADADRAKGAKPPATPKDAWRIGPMLGFAVYAARKGGLRSHPLGAVQPIADGDVLDLPGRPRIIAMPGHSPGSIAVLAPTVRAVLVGDGLTTRSVLTGATGPRPAPFTDDRIDASTSIDRLRDLDVDWIIPGHGAPFHGTPAALLDAYRGAEASRR
jgi:glyoxylase-like metal-dependent hydrolase (beta-lactamase superfamily II)